MRDKDERVDAFVRALLAVDRIGAEQALASEENTSDSSGLVNEIVVPALDRIGRGWQDGGVSLSQVYMAGRICEELMDRLAPAPGAPINADHRIAIAVIQDYHMLGKRMVCSALRSAGYAVEDWGGGMSAKEIASRALDEHVAVLLVSALMLPSALQIGRLTNELGQAPDPPMVAVGGAPFRFDETLWTRVGANAMGRTSSDAVGIVKDFMGGAS